MLLLLLLLLLLLPSEVKMWGMIIVSLLSSRRVLWGGLGDWSSELLLNRISYIY